MLSSANKVEMEEKRADVAVCGQPSDPGAQEGKTSLRPPPCPLINSDAADINHMNNTLGRRTVLFLFSRALLLAALGSPGLAMPVLCEVTVSSLGQPSPSQHAVLDLQLSSEVFFPKLKFMCLYVTNTSCCVPVF